MRPHSASDRRSAKVSAKANVTVAAVAADVVTARMIAKTSGMRVNA